MRQAREILREYRERRQAEAGGAASHALREENLRRLLRHIGAAHQPPEQLESRLLQAMLRAGEESGAHRRSGVRGAARWPWPARSAWQLGAPAAALAAAALVLATQLHRPHGAARVNRPVQRPQMVRLNPAPAPAAKPSSLIGYVLTGDLLRRPAGEEQWQPAGSGAEIHLGDTISTGADTTGRVVFLDDSVCSVLPNTTLQYTAPAQDGLRRPRLLLLARGETWNTVEKGGPPFAVATPTATAVVRGTQFGVAVDAKGKTTLRVTRGKVELQAARGTVQVSAGMQTVALPGHAPQLPVLIAAARPRPSSHPQPATLHIAAPRAGSTSAAGTEGSGKTILRSPTASPKPVAPPDETPPGAPTDSSSSPAASSSDHGTDAPPVSTSP